MFTIAERITILEYRLRGETYAEMQRLFERKYQKDAPTRLAIRKLVNKFRRTGSVADERRAGRPPVSPQSVQRVREAIERSPKASTRRLSHELTLPKSTVWKVLHYTLKKKAYHIQVLHKLEEEDHAARAAMCHDLLEAVDEENLMNHVMFSDEATFHVCGVVNRHNCRIWSEEQPNEFTEWQRDSPKVNVWLGLMKDKIYGPFMFAEKTITGANYLDMLQMFLEPQLQQDGILCSVIYQQDGAPPHYANIVRDYLNETFPNRWIGRAAGRMWAARSPDLTPLDFFAWGFIKSQVYATRVPDLNELKRRIREACLLITPQMLQRVFRATKRRWEQCVDNEGGHVEQY